MTSETKSQEANRANMKQNPPSVNCEIQIGTECDEFHLNFYDTEKFGILAFGEKFANKLCTFLHLNLTFILVAVCAVFGMGLGLVMQTHPAITEIGRIISNTIGVLYGMCWLFEINKSAFKHVVSSTDFWIKIGYSFQFIIFDAIRNYNVYQISVSFIIWYIGVILAVIIVSSYDAINVCKKSKIVCSVLLALLCSFLSIYLDFGLPSDQDYIILIKLFLSEVSCLSKSANAARVIAIFMWKQSFFTFKRENRCVLLRATPYITWN